MSMLPDTNSLKNHNNMEKYYITSDKVGEFIQRMYDKGIRVDAEAKDSRLAIHMPNGGYEWIKVFEKGSFEELCSKFDNLKAE